MGDLAGELDTSHQVLDERSLLVSTVNDISLGGPGVRAALALNALGVPSKVHLVSQNPTIRHLLPTSEEYLCSAKEDSFEPHLIVQYPRGLTVGLIGGRVTSACPNRLIYVNDRPAETLQLHPDLVEFAPGTSFFLVAGFDEMSDEELLHSRIEELLPAVEMANRTGRVLLEESGYNNASLRAVATKSLAKHVPVHSMNEDELQDELGRTINFSSPEDTLNAVDAVLKERGCRTVVVHSRSWALAKGPDAQDLREALRTGTALATTRFIHGDGYGPEEYATTSDLPHEGEAQEFCTQIENLDEVVVCEASLQANPPSPTTIGLGDTVVAGMALALVGKDTKASGAKNLTHQTFWRGRRPAEFFRLTKR